MGGEGMRLQKYLSRAGVASRRAAEDLIAAGRVTVNGVVVTEMGVRVDPAADEVAVDGDVAEIGAPVWVVLHKPPGYVCTRNDRHGRKTVYDLLPAQHTGLFHVGRLDMDSEGLLLLTNQGGVANRMLHPSYEVDREYEVEVKGEVAASTAALLLDGVVLDDGAARAHAVEVLETGPRSRLRVIMREGRKREVRRMLDAVGHPVLHLKRLRFGPIALGDLEAGSWRRLDRDEVRSLRRRTGAGGNDTQTRGEA